MEWILTTHLKYSFPVRWRSLSRLVFFRTNFIVLFRRFESRIQGMFSFFVVSYPFSWVIRCNWVIRYNLQLPVRKGPVFFLFSSCFVTRFNWFCLSWVATPIWAYVIWMQNLSLFFTLLSLLCSQSYLDCRYMKAEPFLFFHLVLSLLGSQSYLSCCYLSAEPFLFSTWFCLS